MALSSVGDEDAEVLGPGISANPICFPAVNWLLADQSRIADVFEDKSEEAADIGEVEGEGPGGDFLPVSGEEVGHVGPARRGRRHGSRSRSCPASGLDGEAEPLADLGLRRRRGSSPPRGRAGSSLPGAGGRRPRCGGRRGVPRPGQAGRGDRAGVRGWESGGAPQAARTRGRKDAARMPRAGHGTTEGGHFQDQKARVPSAISWGGSAPETSMTKTRDPVGVWPLRRS